LRKLKEVDLKSGERKIGRRGMTAIASTQHRNEILLHGSSPRTKNFKLHLPAGRQGFQISH
jgi:hypothetical protein